MDLDLSNDQNQSVADFIVNKDVAIHGWQNYHLILLMAYKKYESDVLVDHCKSLIKRSVESPEVPACFIYLASIGLENEVEEFIEDFKENWSYQHQRYFPIALQNTPQEKLRPMFGKVGYRLLGTVARLQGNKKFKGETVYLKDFNTTVIDEIYDEISPYE